MDFINRSQNNPPSYYLPFGSQCANWAVKALTEAGIPAIASPNLMPDNFLRDLFETIIWNPYTQWINIKANELYGRAIRGTVRDPLAIDLDGDGIETVGLPTTGIPILFDHDADGIRTGTGWLKSDDGWLVRDLNGNGTIDSGRELFGVDTLIVSTDRLDGGNRTITRERNAYNGFDALRVLDTGTGVGTVGAGDGVIDANDAAYAELKIWRDLNQDGISQPGELQSLVAAGIASISIESTLANTNLGNGNTVSATATVTRTSGAQTQVAGVGLDTAGNLNLATNAFYRTFTDSIALTEVAKALPEMGGGGWVRDLREAMSQSGGDALTGVVQQFSAAASRDAQMALIDQLLQTWAASTGRLHVSSELELVQGTVTNETSNTRTTHYETADVQIAFGSYIGQYVQYKFADGAYMKTGTSPNGGEYQSVNDAGMAWLDRRNVLEVFNGQRFFSFDQTTQRSAGGGSGSGGGGGGGGAASTPGSTINWIYSFNGTQVDLIDRAYDALRESVYEALALQTRLAKYLNTIELAIDETGIHFDTAPMLQLLQSAHADDEKVGLEDLSELIKYAQPTLDAVDFDGMVMLRTWIEALPSGSAILSGLQASGLLTVGGSLAATDATDVHLGDASANQVAGGAGDDVLDGGAGDDTIRGGAGADHLYGRSGADVLYGEDGNDTLDGGTGNDTLYGGKGNNTYLFGRGDGQDVVRVTYDTTVGKLNTLQLKPGVTPSDVVLKQVYDVDMGGNVALEFSIAGTADKIVFDGFFYNNDPAGGYNSLQQVKFADGTTW
ncbi:MAG: RTX toxin, partial [Rubrivivax sp.]|nr:RTX toxin [Rubrivivax sp.]